jgi:hypothetical protein
VLQYRTNCDGLRLELPLNLVTLEVIGNAIVGNVFVTGPADDEGEVTSIGDTHARVVSYWLNRHSV